MPDACTDAANTADNNLTECARRRNANRGPDHGDTASINWLKTVLRLRCGTLICFHVNQFCMRLCGMCSIADACVFVFARIETNTCVYGKHKKNYSTTIEQTLNTSQPTFVVVSSFSLFFPPFTILFSSARTLCALSYMLIAFHHTHEQYLVRWALRAHCWLLSRSQIVDVSLSFASRERIPRNLSSESSVRLAPMPWIRLLCV